MTHSAPDTSTGPTTPSPSLRAIEPAAAERIAEVLHAFADPLRIRIASVIATSPGGEMSAGEIASIAEVTAPTVSHHLKVLRESRVLTSDRRGTWLYYRFARGVLPAVIPLLETLAHAANESEAGPAPHTHEPAPDRTPHIDHQTALTHVGERLTERFPSLSPDIVTRTVRESYTALLRTARVDRYVPVLAERFARQRLEDIATSADRSGREPLPRILFVCVANAGRSQLAAALVHRYAGDRVVVRSAGTRPADDVHAAVRPLLAEITGTQDTDEIAFPKPLTDDAVRAADVVVTLGCGDSCPMLPGTRYEDWAVGDPALASPEGVRAIRDDLDRRVVALLAELVPDLAPHLPHNP